MPLLIRFQINPTDKQFDALVVLCSCGRRIKPVTINLPARTNVPAYIWSVKCNVCVELRRRVTSAGARTSLLINVLTATGRALPATAPIVAADKTVTASSASAAGQTRDGQDTRVNKRHHRYSSRCDG